MTGTPALFVHVYAGPGAHWREPLHDIVGAITGAGCPGRLHLGVVGPRFQRPHAVAEAARLAVDGGRSAHGVLVAAEADEGWEQVTLEAVRAHVATHDDPVLYVHTKGASDPARAAFNARWRRSMLARVVGEWRFCLDQLRRVDAVGCHWLTHDQYPAYVHVPFFGGNFWWATAAYLRRQGPVSLESRHEAEAWLGRGDPKVWDLLPGWPSTALFDRPLTRL